MTTGARGASGTQRGVNKTTQPAAIRSIHTVSIPLAAHQEDQENDYIGAWRRYVAEVDYLCSPLRMQQLNQLFAKHDAELKAGHTKVGLAALAASLVCNRKQPVVPAGPVPLFAMPAMIKMGQLNAQPPPLYYQHIPPQARENATPVPPLKHGLPCTFKYALLEEYMHHFCRSSAAASSSQRKK